MSSVDGIDEMKTMYYDMCRTTLQYVLCVGREPSSNLFLLPKRYVCSPRRVGQNQDLSLWKQKSLLLSSEYHKFSQEESDWTAEP